MEITSFRGEYRFLSNFHPVEVVLDGARYPSVEDWDSIKIDVMRDLLRQKFALHADLQQQLLDTGDSVLVEGNTWGDTFWGSATGSARTTSANCSWRFGRR
jgi:predicted NAD-dependent protein-ADP-ribosyltransferase YbiA (DUF1768 family)